ncbi:hypothetical protein ABH920_004870 [Catenulispora sp. EB89]
MGAVCGRRPRIGCRDRCRDLYRIRCQSGYRIAAPDIVRAITSRWISLVPSKIV